MGLPPSRDSSISHPLARRAPLRRSSKQSLRSLGLAAVIIAAGTATLPAQSASRSVSVSVAEARAQRGARLYGQDAKDPKDPPHPWVAAGAEAFYPEGDASGLTVFARDATGRVTHLFARITGGPLMIARRVR